MQARAIQPADEGMLKDESGLSGNAQQIAFPKDTEQLAAVLQAAHQNGWQVTVQGARTGLCGGAVPQGGLVVNLSKMDGFLGVDDGAEGHTLRVQAGASLAAVDAEAAKLGCFFAPNPTEQTATVGGVFATGAAGSYGLVHGAVSRHVARLWWCTPQGKVWDIPRGSYVFDETGCALPNGAGRLPLPAALPALPLAACAAAPGTDLLDFLCGTEGRLGVAAQLELKLLPRPAALWGVVYFWRNEAQLAAFAAWLEGWRRAAPAGPLLAAECLCGGALHMLRAAQGQNSALAKLPAFPAGAQAALFVELGADDEAAVEAALYEQLEQFAALGGNEDDTWAVSGEAEVQRLRQLSHVLTELCGQTASGEGQPARFGPRLEADFAGPPEKAGRYLALYRAGLDEAGLDGVIYGHLLQNALHVCLMPKNGEQRAAAHALIQHWAAQVMQDGGRLVGENATGKLKLPLLEEYAGAEAKRWLRTVKYIFDAGGTMGPGWVGGR